jgi:hypothetical protein
MTADLAQDVLKDVFPQGEVRQVTIERIQEVVCERFSLSLDELCSHKRSQNIVYPRQVAMYLSRELTGLVVAEDRQALRRPRPHHRPARKYQNHEHDPSGPDCVQPCARADRTHQTCALKLWIPTVSPIGLCVADVCPQTAYTPKTPCLSGTMALSRMHSAYELRKVFLKI